MLKVHPVLKVHDTPLYSDCTHKRRVDHGRLIGDTMVMRIGTEKDEEICYDDLYMIHSGKWIFI